MFDRTEAPALTLAPLRHQVVALLHVRQADQRDAYHKRQHRRGGHTGHYSNDRRTPSENTTGDRHPTSIVTVGRENNSRLHATQKPVDLCEWLVRTYTNEGDTVLDPTMGCGSTGMAARKNKRRFIGCELDPSAMKTARKRLCTDDPC